MLKLFFFIHFLALPLNNCCLSFGCERSLFLAGHGCVWANLCHGYFCVEIYVMSNHHLWWNVYMIGKQFFFRVVKLSYLSF